VTAPAFVLTVESDAPFAVLTRTGQSVPVEPVPASSISGAGFPSVANAAALTALDVTGFPRGTIAFVASFGGSYWSLQPAGPTPDGSTVLAASNGGVWTRFGQADVVAALDVSDWYVDPVAGVDEAVGTSIGAPVKHMAEVMRRWAGMTSTSAALTAPAVVIHLLAPMVASDAVNWTLTLAAGNTFNVLGTLTQLAGPVPLDAVGAPNFAAGTLASVTVTSHVWTRGQLIRDATANCSFWTTENATGLVHVTPGIALPATFPPTAQAPSVADSVTVQKCPAFYVTSLAVFGSFQSATLTNVDVSSPQADNETVIANVSLLECHASAYVSNGSLVSNPTVVNSWGEDGSGGGAGAFYGAFSFFAGGQFGNGPFYDSSTILDFDTVQMGTRAAQGTVFIGQAYMDNWLSTNIDPSSEILFNTVTQVPARMWGPAGVDVIEGQRLIGRVSVTGTLLLTGGLQIDGAGTAFAWNAGAHAFNAAEAISVANLAATAPGGLQNPATGSRITFPS
jgi:hypothetical protein